MYGTFIYLLLLFFGADFSKQNVVVVYLYQQGRGAAEKPGHLTLQIVNTAKTLHRVQIFPPEFDITAQPAVRSAYRRPAAGCGGRTGAGLPRPISRILISDCVL